MLGKTFIVLVQCVGGPLHAGWSFLITASSKWRGVVAVRKSFSPLLLGSYNREEYPSDVWITCAANLRYNWIDDDKAMCHS